MKNQMCLLLKQCQYYVCMEHVMKMEAYSLNQMFPQCVLTHLATYIHKDLCGNFNVSKCRMHEL